MVVGTTCGEELVEIVDEHDHVVAVVSRRRMRAENLRHRAVYVLVVDATGRVLLHRRSDAKDVWPGRWDLAAGGVVGVGEAYDVAARRELAEELGIADAVVESLGSCAFEDESVAVIGWAFRVCHDGPFDFADGEVVEAAWVTPAELAERLERDPFVPDSPALLQAFLT
jgi:isopentenyldiphosphate isomerase